MRVRSIPVFSTFLDKMKEKSGLGGCFLDGVGIVRALFCTYTASSLFPAFNAS